MDVGEALFQIGRRGRLWSEMPLYALRLARFAWLHFTKSATHIAIPFGIATFDMHIQALGPREGARGIFLFRENYEPLLRFGAPLIHPGDVVFDLGANQGVYACAFAAATGGRGQVIAVEPIPHQAERVRANVALNGFSNCRVVEKAISDRDGRATLHVGYGDTAASIVVEGGHGSIEVATTTVDRLVRELGLSRVDFIKLDVEGAEMLALRGAAETLRRFRPGLAVEAADAALFEEIRAFLTPFGYSFSVYDDNGGLAPVGALARLEDNVICLCERPPAPAAAAAIRA